MSDTVISVEHLSKRYSLGAARSNERYTALRDVIANKTRSFFRRSAPSSLNSQLSTSSSDFWALKDVSFDIKQGEVVGIIGRNGAGKSTLLKILSRITDPTEGKIKIKGRIASLLEVGTGFHPELTGRENVFLNGAILGMHRAEIKAKFDEIVAFAEVEKFLDTPVKRYSSGMYVRLAFAVAAHLEPEILIVDEVLAVGDAEFQKKCLGKMQDVAGHGRTVLFVSHSLSAILGLCSEAIMLQQGAMTTKGCVMEVCKLYTATSSIGKSNTDSSKYLQSIALVDGDGKEVSTVDPANGLHFRFSLLPQEKGWLMSLIIKDQKQNVIFELFDELFSPSESSHEVVNIQVSADAIQLLPGIYIVDFWLADRFAQRIELVGQVLQFEILSQRKSDRNINCDGFIEVPSKWVTV